MAHFNHSFTADYKDIDLSWMVGRLLTDVSFIEPVQWSFSFGPDVRIEVMCLWRIVEHGRIGLTSEDHGHKFGLPAHIDAVARGTGILS